MERTPPPSPIDDDTNKRRSGRNTNRYNLISFQLLYFFQIY
jgi:hypothetical protein